MRSRSVPLAVLVIAAPMALFRRKAKDGWLGELEQIRGEALGNAHDEIGPAMGSDAAGADDPPAQPAEPGASTVDRTAGQADVVTERRAQPEARTPQTQPARPGAAPVPPPAPHRQRPSELWHAPLDVSAVAVPQPVAPEELLRPIDLTEAGDDQPARRPFASARPAGLVVDASAPGQGSDPAQPAGAGAHSPGTSADDVSGEPAVDVLSGRDVADDWTSPSAAGSQVSQGRRGRPVSEAAPAGTGGSADRPRIRPPTDIFDVAPALVEEHASAPAQSSLSATSGHGSEGDGTVDSADRPAGAPLARRPVRSGPPRRSLFGPVGPVGAPAATGGPAGEPTSSGRTDDALGGHKEQARPVTDEPAQVDGAGGQPAVVDDDGAVAVDGVILRFSDPALADVRPALPDAAGRAGAPALAAVVPCPGWCWVASEHSAPGVRVAFPGGHLDVRPGTRTLVVVEADRSSFVSVVSGHAELGHRDGPAELGAGGIAHVPEHGPVMIDTASPDEMASDPILTRNLRLDDTTR